MHKRTWIKILLGISLLIIVVIITNIILKSVVEKKLRASFQQFQPYIQAGFSRAHINVFAGSIQLDSLYFFYDPELNQQHQHKIYFPDASINNIHFLKLVTTKNFSAGSLKLKNAKIIYDHYLLYRHDTIPAGILKKTGMPFKLIFFNAVELQDIKAFEQDNNKITTVCTGSIFLNDVQIPHIDSSFSKDSIHFSGIACDFNDINYHLQGYYSVTLKKLHISSKDSLMQLDSLKLVPQLSKFQLGEKLGRQADHVNASIKNIKITGADIMKLRQKKFIAEEMNVETINAYIFRDRRLPRSQKKQPMPLDYLKQIPFELNVQRFNLNNATITSEEFPKEGEHSGYIKLERLFITMGPLINYPGKEDAVINSYIKASIMGAGDIHATINLSTLDGNSEIKGAIDNLDLPALNPSAENLGKFHIQSGVLNRLDFQFTATNTKASGQIVGVYHNLVIDRLKLTEQGLKKAWLPSFALHHIIIPKNKDASLNVKKRTGKIDYNRDPTRLVSFYYLKALLDGIRNSFNLGFLLPQ